MKLNIEAIILKLLESHHEISIPEIADAAKLSNSDEGDRKAIRRALNSLAKQELVQAKGNTRSRTFVSTKSAPIKNSPSAEIQSRKLFKEIQLSKDAQTVLAYVSQATMARKPVSYNQIFLRNYRPNKDFYLNEKQRSELLELGRVENKERPAGTYARNILDKLLIYLSWNSSRLEGNTYSLLETQRLIELGDAAAGKDATETQMILNHKAAIEYIVETSSDEPISSHEICSIHSLLSENLLGDPGAYGRIRNIAVAIKGSTYIPLDNNPVLQECFDLLVAKLSAIEDPFEQSFFALVHLSYLQAFEDVNKRTARLVANISLIKKNLRPLSFADVDQDEYVKALLGVYELNDVSLFRDLYLWAYHRSSQQYSAIQQAMGKPNLFKLKYRSVTQQIVQTIILEAVPGPQVVHRIQNLIENHKIPKTDTQELFKVIETEIMSLHDGNIARFKVRPSEYQAWKKLQ